MSTKLSKRKQKALAFRGKKPKEINSPTDLDDVFGDADSIPLETPEESSWLGNDTKQPKSTKPKTKLKNQKPPPSEPQTTLPTPSKKRKLEADTDTPSKSKKRKPDTEDTGPSKRYIVFVGNLPHSSSETLLPALKAHFPAPPTSIRIPTKKTTSAPQGFAFLEFDSSPAMEKALRMHHTVLLKRKINVELTAGGGGRGENRMGKIKKRNEGLDEERRKRVEEEKNEKGEKQVKTDGIHPDRLKRMQHTT
jgi:nucleolar protein 6